MQLCAPGSVLVKTSINWEKRWAVLFLGDCNAGRVKLKKPKQLIKIKIHSQEPLHAHNPRCLPPEVGCKYRNGETRLHVQYLTVVAQYSAVDVEAGAVMTIQRTLSFALVLVLVIERPGFDLRNMPVSRHYFSRCHLG